MNKGLSAFGAIRTTYFYLPPNATKIFIYRNKPEKEIIGYFAVHRFEKFIVTTQVG